MGFTPTFYAGRPKLSEVTIDSDLNMGGRNISGVDTLQAGRVDSPYTTETWPTEELDWGDTPESVQTLKQDSYAYGDDPVVMFTAVAGSKPTKWLLNFTTARSGTGYYSPSKIQILVDGVEILHTNNLGYTSYEFVFYPPTGASIVVNHICGGSYSARILAGASLRDTGMVVGPKTFDLTGKWLALGIDMKGLDATIKIQGVEMPYSDYAKYFPLAPTELTIPGEWDASQIRPIVEVYV